MTHFLHGLAGGRTILVLEGGYNVTSTSYAMTMCTKALLGDPITHHYDPKPTCHWSAVETINNVIRIQKKYWKSLKFQLALPIEDVLEKPAPSRGLIINENRVDDGKSQKDSSISLEDSMGNLSIGSKCSDGIHCGTDGEDSPSASQENKENKNEQGEETKTLVDFLSENMQAIVDEEMFAVVPLQWCPHLESLYAIPADVKFEQGVKCVDCDHVDENWVCLHCYVVSISLNNMF